MSPRDPRVLRPYNIRVKASAGLLFCWTLQGSSSRLNHECKWTTAQTFSCLLATWLYTKNERGNSVDCQVQCTHCIPSVGANLQIISQSYFCDVTWSLAQSDSEKSSLIFPASHSAHSSASQDRAVPGLLGGTREIFCLLLCLWQRRRLRVGKHLTNSLAMRRSQSGTESRCHCLIKVNAQKKKHYCLRLPYTKMKGSETLADA